MCSLISLLSTSCTDRHTDLHHFLQGNFAFIHSPRFLAAVGYLAHLPEVFPGCSRSSSTAADCNRASKLMLKRNETVHDILHHAKLSSSSGYHRPMQVCMFSTRLSLLAVLNTVHDKNIPNPPRGGGGGHLSHVWREGYC